MQIGVRQISSAKVRPVDFRTTQNCVRKIRILKRGLHTVPDRYDLYRTALSSLALVSVIDQLAAELRRQGLNIYGDDFRL